MNEEIGIRILQKLEEHDKKFLSIEKSTEDLRQEINALEERMTEKIDTRIAESEKRMTEKIDASIAESEKRMTLKIASAKEEMLGKMCAFEHDYGHEIDAIYDIALMQMDKANEIYEESEELKKKVDNLDTKFFSLEHRVFKLEHNANP